MLIRSPLFERLNFSQARTEVETHGEGDKKKLYLKGIFIQGGVRNHNGRVYPEREITRAVNQITETLKSGEDVLGELDHPEELNINAKYASHCIESMWMENTNGMGKLRILNTPNGLIARTLIEEGIKLGVSSRGSGNVDHNGYVSDFDMVTVDIVARPSAPNAHPKPIYEARFGRHGRELLELAGAVRADPRFQRDLARLCLDWIKTK